MKATVPGRVHDDHAPRRRHRGRARRHRRHPVHVAVGVARMRAVELRIPQRGADDIGSPRLGPFRGRGPVVLFDRRLASDVFGDGQHERGAKGGADELAWPEAPCDRERRGPVAVAAPAHVVDAADEIPLAHDLHRGEGFVFEVGKAGVEQRDQHAFSRQAPLVELGNADLRELLERGAVVERMRAQTPEAMPVGRRGSPNGLLRLPLGAIPVHDVQAIDEGQRGQCANLCGCRLDARRVQPAERVAHPRHARRHLLDVRRRNRLIVVRIPGARARAPRPPAERTGRNRQRRGLGGDPSPLVAEVHPHGVALIGGALPQRRVEPGSEIRLSSLGLERYGGMDSDRAQDGEDDD